MITCNFIVPPAHVEDEPFNCLLGSYRPPTPKWLRRGRLRFAHDFEAKSGGGGGNRISTLKPRTDKICNRLSLPENTTHSVCMVSGATNNDPCRNQISYGTLALHAQSL
jgi:hypothetical protein